MENPLKKSPCQILLLFCVDLSYKVTNLTLVLIVLHNNILPMLLPIIQKFISSHNSSLQYLSSLKLSSNISVDLSLKNTNNTEHKMYTLFRHAFLFINSITTNIQKSIFFVDQKQDCSPRIRPSLQNI